MSLALTACLETVDPPLESTIDQDVQASNGTSLNGTSLNGTSLNGTTLNGTSLKSVATANAKLSSVTLTNVALTGSAISAKKGITNVSGTALIGAVFTGTATNNAAVTLRIDGVHALAAPNADVTAYVVSYQTSSTWTPLCPNTGNEAIPMTGTWNLTTGSHQLDANLFTFACRDATFAKCVELGYKPWDTVAGVNLANHHEACTRALRADYCGDGTSNTVNGTLINIYDSLNVQSDSLGWKIESNWTASGAVCIGTPRVLTITQATVPACVWSRSQTPCAPTGWAGGILLRTEVNK